MYNGKTVLVTGGAGFVGSHLALAFKRRFPAARVIVLDNLKRRGSELNIKRLIRGGVEFLHGDVRNKEDLTGISVLDLLIECSAEPSVLAGYSTSADYVIGSNLMGAVHCLEVAKAHQAAFIFLSTSRVYPVKYLNDLSLVEKDTRFELAESQPVAGVSPAGIDHTFPLEGARSLYGATKLSAELLIQEYRDMYGLQTVINRCGVIAGPGQMGRVDQGILAFWLAAHIYEKPLSYIGFGGMGKQVRDMLHIEDLSELILTQALSLEKADGKARNAGGGREGSVSLFELTQMCEAFTGKRIPVTAVPETRPADIPLYITDNKAISDFYGWRPTRGITRLVEETAQWIYDNKEMLRPIFCAE
ncbi:MAG: CDP-paratose 2-epimerase [Candidatus Hydrogenedentes bacterium ADurb.Bin170]|nr:MAG: CDP-paratose 2-epimerase [Candidatus Hydrogenedentes bacterium ADurb.Bin170]